MILLSSGGEDDGIAAGERTSGRCSILTLDSSATPNESQLTHGLPLTVLEELSPWGPMIGQPKRRRRMVVHSKSETQPPSTPEFAARGSIVINQPPNGMPDKGGVAFGASGLSPCDLPPVPNLFQLGLEGPTWGSFHRWAVQVAPKSRPLAFPPVQNSRPAVNIDLGAQTYLLTYSLEPISLHLRLYYRGRAATSLSLSLFGLPIYPISSLVSTFPLLL